MRHNIICLYAQLMSMAKHTLAVFLHLSNSMSCYLQPVIPFCGSCSNIFYFPSTFNIVQTKEDSSDNTFFTTSGTMFSNHIPHDFPNSSNSCMSKVQPVPHLNRLKFTQKKKGGILDSGLHSTSSGTSTSSNTSAISAPFQKGRKPWSLN